MAFHRRVGDNIQVVSTSVKRSGKRRLVRQQCRGLPGVDGYLSLAVGPVSGSNVRLMFRGNSNP